MQTYAWIALGMLAAGIGGALATWGSMVFLDHGLEPEPPGVLTNIAVLGGVLAALCGGIASIGRGKKADRKKVMGNYGAIGLALVLGLFAVTTLTIIPASLILLIRAPLQGLAALLGGFTSLAALWAALRLAGIRNESDLAMPFRGAVATPLGKAGVIALAISFVLPLLPYLKDSPEGIALSSVVFLGGILLCGASFVLRGASRSCKPGTSVVEASDAADSR
jgi:hypothetical protein